MVDPPGIDETLPLGGFAAFASSDFETLRHALCRTLTPHRLRRIGGDAPVHGRINTAHLPGMRFHAMHVGPSVEVLPTHLSRSFMLHMPVFGATRFSIGKCSFEADGSAAAIMSPGMPIRAVWESECTAVLLCIEVNALERHLEHVVGFPLHQPLCFAPALDLSSTSGAAWRRLWNYVLRELEMSGPVRSPTLRDSETARLLMSTVLSVVPHNYSAALEGALQEDCPRFLMRAEAFMRARAGNPPTLAQIAAAAGVATRTLHKAFVRHRGRSPLRALRAMRLEGARSDLLTESPTMSITEIALRWGFTELGRFALEYRQRYGELPSETRRHAGAVSRV
jgi:AraC-like DNA-binding protein